MENLRPRIVYILPEYDEGTGTHFFYNYELIREASLRMDIFVVIERAKSSNISLGKAEYYVQKNRSSIARLFELRRILKRCKKEGYLNVYVHYSYFGALAGFLVSMKVYYWNRGMPWLFRRSFFEERIFRFILRHSVLVTSPDELAKEYVKKYGVKSYKILSDWIDAERFRPKESKIETKRRLGLSEQKKIILFVHHLSERKGADLISKIASVFQGQGAEFIVVGEGPYRKNLEMEVENSNGLVKILGQVPNKDIPRYFHAADVFLMPSREEGSPHVLLEAMASGTPFVAADIGGVKALTPREYLEFLCKSGDVSCFQAKIRKLLANDELRKEFSKKGLEFVRDFNLSMAAAKFEALFRN